MNTSTSLLFSFFLSFHLSFILVDVCLSLSSLILSLPSSLFLPLSTPSLFVSFQSTHLIYHLLHTQHKQTRKTITSFKRQQKHYQQMSLIILLYVKYVNIPGDGCFETTQNNLNGKESHSYQIIAKHHFLNIHKPVQTKLMAKYHTYLQYKNYD